MDPHGVLGIGKPPVEKSIGGEQVAEFVIYKWLWDGDPGQQSGAQGERGQAADEDGDRAVAGEAGKGQLQVGEPARAELRAGDGQ